MQDRHRNRNRGPKRKEKEKKKILPSKYLERHNYTILTPYSCLPVSTWSTLSGV